MHLRIEPADCSSLPTLVLRRRTALPPPPLVRLLGRHKVVGAPRTEWPLRSAEHRRLDGGGSRERRRMTQQGERALDRVRHFEDPIELNYRHSSKVSAVARSSVPA